MNDLARQKLCEIVVQQGRGVCDDSRRLRGLLGDYCPGLKREINALTTAVEQRVVSDLLKLSAGSPWEIVAGRLVKRLIDEVAMNEDAARWTIDSWGLALSLTTTVRPSPTPVHSAEENLLRWQQSGEPQRWVAERQGNWNHSDWLALLNTLRTSPFWPMELAKIGMVLETSKQAYLTANRPVPPAPIAPQPVPPKQQHTSPQPPVPAQPGKTGSKKRHPIPFKSGLLLGLLAIYFCFSWKYPGYPGSFFFCAAWLGLPWEQASLGDRYYNGTDGADKDFTLSAKWYRKAADQGHAMAQYNLGVMYSKGQGVEKDEVEAMKWYRKAADQGLADAQYNLGCMYHNGYDNGQGMVQDQAEATSWFHKAADQGHAKGQALLSEANKGKVRPAALNAPFTEQEAKAAQAAWAKYLGRKVEEEIDLGGGVKLIIVLVPSGTFKMGSPADEKERNYFEKDFDAEKLHDVEISKPFYLAKYPVTQEQYEAIIGKNPSRFQAGEGGADKVNGLSTKQFPVERVSWDEAQTFCKKLKYKDRQSRKFRLPSEAEWEYACRAGTTTPFYFGSELNGKKANCNGNYPYETATGPYKDRTTKVGEYGENKWGLCDMHGNVWQWCEDYYGPYNDDLKAIDPLRSVKYSKECRVLRGGSWSQVAEYCRAACRFYYEPETRDRLVGFRVCVRVD